MGFNGILTNMKETKMNIELYKGVVEAYKNGNKVHAKQLIDEHKGWYDFAFFLRQESKADASANLVMLCTLTMIGAD